MAVSSATSASSGTNIDVGGIVGKLMAVEQKPLTALNTKEASYQSKISAFGQVKGALSAFQTALQGLNNQSKFQANVATSSDPSVFTASASVSAAIGSHAINVTALAQGQRLATAGIANSTTPIGSGLLSFEFGNLSGDTFTPNVGKYRTAALNNAMISNATVLAKAGTAITAAQSFTPDANSSGTIPAGTLTLNGIEVGEINLLDADSPLHRAMNIAAALDEAYVRSGGTPGTFTAAAGVVNKADDGGNAATFGVAGVAPNPDEAAANVRKLSSQLGVSVGQLGTQQTFGNATVTVASTADLSVGDKISGGGFPEGTTITEIIDATHFMASAIGTDTNGTEGGVTLNTSTLSSRKSVTIDPGSTSLQGIRDAINAAKIGVTASIVNDGSAAPNRLVLSSDAIGANTSMRVTVREGNAALANLLSHDPSGTKKLSEISAASNASLTVDGIPVSKDSNNINDVIQGVTLNLLRPGDAPATLDVSRDTGAVKTSVEEFVKSYNELKKVITELTAYNEATKKGAALQGDSAMRSLESQIDTLLSTPLNTPAGSLNTLSQIGVSKQANGTLALDAAKFDKAMETKFSEVAALFSSIGKTTDSQVNFKSTSSATKSGNYSVSISQLATQGSVTGNMRISEGSTTISSGTTLSVTIDGSTAAVALPPGGYNGSQLAKMLQDAINATPAFASRGKGVNAIIDGNGFLNIRSSTYGSASSVILANSAGTPVSDFMGTPVSAPGMDVAGLIDGAPATGLGQQLTSNAGKSNGLQVQIAGGAIGPRGTVNYTEGFARKLNDFVNSALSNNGLLTGRLNGLNSSVKGISKERDTINARLTTIEDRYRRQYTKLDSTLSSMNKTSAYLSQQLAKM